MGLLYHASENIDLDVLKPQRTISHDMYIGDYVFATANKVLAAMYLVPKGYGTIMKSDVSSPQLLIRATEAEVKDRDKGGAIYAVEGSLFTDTPQTELSAYEKVSKRAVKPISKDVYESVSEAWKKMGIEVRFIDQATFDQSTKK